MLVLGCQSAMGQSKDDASGNYHLPYCRQSEKLTKTDPETLITAGLCQGVVDAFLLAGSRLAPEYRYCVPQRANLGQGVRVVIKYLEANPERLHEDFRILVMDAFKSAWPCKSRP